MSSNMIALLLVLSSVLGLALGAPIEDWQPPLGNLSALQTTVAPPWVSSHPTRGTFEILYSCSFTLLLCIYTALHLNVPPPDDKKRHYYLRKAKWALTALFGPEVILYAAWDQWCDAREFSKSFNYIKKAPEQKPQVKKVTAADDAAAAEVARYEKDTEGEATVEETTQPSSPEPSKGDSCGEVSISEKQGTVPTVYHVDEVNEDRVLTLADGFYAGMGGYVVDVTETKKIGDLEPGRYTLSRQWIIALAEILKYNFPIASRQTIEDKSKANLLAKILVCFQVSFLVMQSLARKVHGYPLTLLELHTLVHVICAFAMYGLWFRKPLEIYEPTVVELSGEVIARFNATTTSGMNIIEHPLHKSAQNIGAMKTAGGHVWFLGCAVHGAVHLTAWNYIFPTEIERYLWKVACLIAVSGFLVTPAWLLIGTEGDEDTGAALHTFIFQGVRKLWEKSVYCWNNAFESPTRFSRAVFYFTQWIGVIITPLFFVARILIVILAFTSLRSVPAGVYADVPWTQYFPHV